MKNAFLLMLLNFFGVQGLQAFEVSSSAILRYENETDQVNLTPRKRVRLIASVAATHHVNKRLSVVSQVRTGLKNRQNVPAVTLYQKTNNPSGDKDIFISQLYTRFSLNNLSATLGKIPWQSKQISDLFWDRHLNPIGLHLEYSLAQRQKLVFATFNPLDGQTNTVGHMSLIQYQTVLAVDNALITLSPWFVDYTGEVGANFATGDTQFDNRFLRFSGSIKLDDVRFGLDLGWSIHDVPNELHEEFSKERQSYVIEFRKGSLSKVGHYLTELKYIYAERFSVVTEFAQNASSRFATSNYKGWDFRIRYKLTSKQWLGARISQTKRLVGEPEQSVRFRIETKLSF
ncbi:hypothetical protein [Paraglaciecola sp. 2405UD69-4]|uniref:hypothetical protein n=1 Tax=Paraglaciecola sp. 2405UD69-4 TaxID=3391836 RepID=UPI0039C9B64A